MDNQKLDYFKILEIPKKYDVNRQLIEKNFQKQLMKLHPDYAENENEKIQAITKTIALNEAYDKITDDIKRSVYLLQQQNISIDDKNIRNKLDTNELEKIFDKEMIVEQTQNIDKLQKISQDNLDMIQKIKQNIADNFQSRKFIEMALNTIKLKYIYKNQQNVQDKIQLIKTK